jgi:hypothetical protein
MGRSALPTARFIERYDGQTVVVRHHQTNAIPLTPAFIVSISPVVHFFTTGKKRMSRSYLP